MSKSVLGYRSIETLFMMGSHIDDPTNHRTKQQQQQQIFDGLSKGVIDIRK